MGFIRTLRRGVFWGALGGAAGALVVTTRYLLETPQPLESKLPGTARIDRGHGGDIYYNVAGPQDAEPLVLLHDFYPGASNYDFRRVFPALAAARRVYAPDWLGFGMSERPQVAYTGEFYANALGGFLRGTVGRPATVVAQGHAANIAVRAATDAPALFARLVLVSPNPATVEEQAPGPSQALVRAAQRAALGLVPYALLSSRPVLRWTSQARSMRMGQGAASDESVEQRYASAHQFGGQHAVLALLTGELDLPMGNALAVLEPPLLILSGALDPRRPRSAMEDLAVLNPHAGLEIIPDAGPSVVEDQPDAFVQALSRWIATPQSRLLLDESALLPPQAIQQGHASGTAGQEVPPTGATGASEDDMAARGPAADEAAPGTPGFVVPGVSDMGLDGPAAVTVGDITTLEPEITLGQEQPETDMPADESDDTVELVPEAAERAARAGIDPQTEPASNIADVAAAARDLAEQPADDAALAGPGEVAGLAHIVQTPDTAVETPENAVTTPERAVETPTADAADAAGSPGSRSRPQQSTRAAPREPSARTQKQQGQSRGRSGKTSSGERTGNQSRQPGGKRQTKRRSTT